jgi:hypothetical protein
MPFAGTIRVEGLRELQRACALSEKEVKLGVRAKLREAAEPVRTEAESLGPTMISNLGPEWRRMKVGVTTSLVYVAPKSRRHGGSPRKNLAPLLMKVMESALDAKTDEVAGKLEEAIDLIAERHW